MNTTELELIRSLTRDSYADFVREFWSTISAERLEWNWHMDVICEDLQKLALRVAAGQPKLHDELINISPGTSKSSLCSILYIPWVWTFMPHAQFIVASHSEKLALDLSNKSRDVIKSDKYRECFPEIKLRADQDTKGNFKNTKGGYRYAVGSGGTVIGFHGHFIIIDDPIDPNASLSEAELKSTNHWIKQTLRSRKVNKRVTVTIMVMQRLHQDDPAAQMKARKNVRHLCIPAETGFRINPPELADRYVDGLMDPDRLPREFLEEERLPTGMGEYGYAGQYGQDPVPAGGGMFKTHLLRWGRPPERFVATVRYWDKAATEGDGAYTVGVKGAMDHAGNIWVLDVARFRKDSYRREKVIKRVAQHDGRAVVVGVEQEGGSGGKESAEGTMRRLMQLGFRVRPLSPRGDKELRADEFSYYVNGGMVFLPERLRQGNTWVGWAAEYVDELKHFPFSTFKDQVDGSSGLLTCLVTKRRRVGGMRRAQAWKEEQARRPLAGRGPR